MCQAGQHPIKAERQNAGIDAWGSCLPMVIIAKCSLELDLPRKLFVYLINLIVIPSMKGVMYDSPFHFVFLRPDFNFVL